MNKSFLKSVLESSILIAIIESILCYAILSYWQRDGLSIMECSFNSFVTGFIVLLACLIAPIPFVKKYLSQMKAENIKPVHPFLVLLTILVVSYIFYIGIDYILYFLDSSISIDISETMAKIPGTDKYASKQEILDMANYPVAFINWSVNIVFGFIGILISYIFIRKTA